MVDILNTGERILLEKETPLMIARHFCAYKFAENYAHNKIVMDVGCGEGYGSYYLSSFAKQVVGIDYDKEIINYAKNKYQKDNLSFYVLEAESLGSLNNKFDIICSFQVIEHMRNTKLFLENIKNLLNDNGILICSTPNKLDASPHSSVPVNKFHVKEYLYDEFKELLGSYFRKIDIYGLKRGKRFNFYRRVKKIGVCNFLPASLNPVKKFYSQINCNDFVIVKNNLDTALDFIAVCVKT